MESNHPITLAGLKSDVIRIIVGMEILSFKCLRMISKIWNSSTIAEIDKISSCNRGRFPVIHSLTFRRTAIKIVLPSGCRNFFCVPPTFLDNEDPNTDIVEITIHSAKYEPQFTRVFITPLTRLISRSSQIEEVKLDVEQYWFDEIIAVTDRVLDGANINLLYFHNINWLNPEKAEKILQLIQKATVHRLKIAARSSTISIRDFVTSAFPFVRHLYISAIIPNRPMQRIWSEDTQWLRNNKKDTMSVLKVRRNEGDLGDGDVFIQVHPND